ncbi:MAG: hypothetical protein R3C05_02850 [Pirellulaceae bacterium]
MQTAPSREMEVLEAPEALPKEKRHNRPTVDKEAMAEMVAMRLVAACMSSGRRPKSPDLRSPTTSRSRAGAAMQDTAVHRNTLAAAAEMPVAAATQPEEELQESTASLSLIRRQSLATQPTQATVELVATVPILHWLAVVAGMRATVVTLGAAASIP